MMSEGCITQDCDGDPDGVRAWVPHDELSITGRGEEHRGGR